MLLAALPPLAACRGKAKRAAQLEETSRAEGGEPGEPREHGERDERGAPAAPSPAGAEDTLAGAFLDDLAWHHPDSELFFAAELPSLRATPLWRDGVEAWLGSRAPATWAALRACPGDPLAALTRASLTLRTPGPDIFCTLVVRGARASELLACLRAAAPQLAADGLVSDDLQAPTLALRAATSDSSDVLALRAAGERIVVASFGTVPAEPDLANAKALRDTPDFVALVRAAPPRTALWLAMVGGSSALVTLQQRGISFAYLSASLALASPVTRAPASSGPPPGQPGAPGATTTSSPATSTTVASTATREPATSTTVASTATREPATAPVNWTLEAQLHTATPEQATRYAKATTIGAKLEAPAGADATPIAVVTARGNDVLVRAEGTDEQLRAFVARRAAAAAAP